MKKRALSLAWSVIVTFVWCSLQGQQLVIKPDFLQMQKDMQVLASDSLIGRETGTYGEWMASNYIEKRFRELELKPLFGNSYFQPFTVKEASFIDTGTVMLLNQNLLDLYLDYYPLGFSANSKVSGTIYPLGNGVFCPEQGVNDYWQPDSIKGKIVLINLSVPSSYIKNNQLWDSTQKKVRASRAAALGAKAVIFYNTDTNYGEPLKNPKYYDYKVDIPVVFLQKNEYLNFSKAMYAEISVNISPGQNRMGHNVGGFIDNNAPHTVVIGAHYDHLGMGAFSTRDEGNTEVHNGADDNASGVVGVLQLAAMLQKSECKNNNYIFVAFSGEELGLLGSFYFVKNTPVPLDSLNYMINLDMIGRLDNKNNLKIYGTGTSSNWNQAIADAENNALRIKKIKLGIGGSDHTAFNMAGIPALFIHTGLHEEYHTAADDINLINYNGMEQVVNYSFSLIKQLNPKGKLDFQTKGILNTIILNK